MIISRVSFSDIMMSRNRNIYLMPLFVVVLFLFAISSVAAQVEITEIMYDLEGGDSGREWVEIHNASGGSVDLSDWRFYEQGTNHTFQNEGDVTLGAGEYAIIADDVSVFKSDWPSTGVLILDSSFSLKNTGEYISLKNPDGVEVDALTYVPQTDADGGGASLQLISGNWDAYLPTPGRANEATLVASDTTAEEDNGGGDNTDTDAESSGGIGTRHNTDTTSSGSSGGSVAVAPKQITADAGGDRTVIVGAPASFYGTAYGFTGDVMDGKEQYRWNMGDGSSHEGENITHTYRVPGEYTATLSVISGKYSGTDRVTVRVIEAAVDIPEVVPGPDGYVRIENTTDSELDLSGWRLDGGVGSFAFPRHSILAARRSIPIANEVTGLSVTATTTVTLRYPNGREAAVYHPNPLEQMRANVENTDVQDTIDKTPAAESHKTQAVQGTKDRTAAASPVSVAEQTARESLKDMAATNTLAELTAQADQGAENAGDNSTLVWVGALVVVLAAASVGVLVFSSGESTVLREEGIEKLAGEYEIVEDE